MSIFQISDIARDLRRGLYDYKALQIALRNVRYSSFTLSNCLFEALDYRYHPSLIDNKPKREWIGVVEASRPRGHDTPIRRVVLKLNELECVRASDSRECIELLLNRRREARQVNDACVCEKLVCGDVLRNDEVLNGRFGAGEPGSEAESGVIERIAHGAERLDALEGFTDDAGDKGRRRGRGNTRADNDGRQAKDTTVDESTTGILIDEQLRGQLAHAVGTFWRGNGRGSNNFRKGTTIHSEGRGEYEFGEYTNGGAFMSSDVEQEANGVDIDLKHSEVLFSYN